MHKIRFRSTGAMAIIHVDDGKQNSHGLPESQIGEKIQQERSV